MIRILGRDNSINVRKVLWCCDELGLEWEREDFGGPFGKTDTAEYRALNPNGLVPTVLDGDLAIWESNTIVRYLAGKYGGGAPLYPVDPAARAPIEQWMDWQLTVTGPPTTFVFISLIRTPPEERDMDALAKNRDLWARAMMLLDGALGTGPYIMGGGFTLADIPLGLAVNRWFSLEIEREPLDNLARYYDTLQEREAFRTHGANGLP